MIFLGVSHLHQEIHGAHKVILLSCVLQTFLGRDKPVCSTTLAYQSGISSSCYKYIKTPFLSSDTR